MKNINSAAKKRLPNSMIKYLVIIILLLLIALVFIVNGRISAKYVHGEDHESLYIAKEFYFESDYLKPMMDNGSYVSYTLQAGVDTINFELRNYSDGLRSSEVDIDYKIYLNGVEQKDKKGQLKFSDSGTKATISLPGLTGGTYLVTATAVEPYSSTIGAQFIIVDEVTEIDYIAYGSAESPVLLLTVNTNDYSGKIALSWDANNVYPDITDPLLEGAVASSGSHTVELESNSEYTFRFFKSNLTKDYKSSLYAETVTENN